LAPRSRFSTAIRKTAKVHNAAEHHEAKVAVRRLVLQAVGGQVFDAFAGAGVMYRRVWREAPGYCGCDLLWSRDDRLAFVADNRRVLRAIDLQPYSIFDLDAHGSPWEQAWIVASRRLVAPGERVGLVLTEGSGLKLKMGGYPRALLWIAGLEGTPSGGAALHGEIIGRALRRLAMAMCCRLADRWEAKGKTGAAVRYLGLVFVGEKKSPPAGGRRA